MVFVIMRTLDVRNRNGPSQGFSRSFFSNIYSLQRKVIRLTWPPNCSWRFRHLETWKSHSYNGKCPGTVLSGINWASFFPHTWHIYPIMAYYDMSQQTFRHSRKKNLIGSMTLNLRLKTHSWSWSTYLQLNAKILIQQISRIFPTL